MLEACGEGGEYRGDGEHITIGGDRQALARLKVSIQQHFCSAPSIGECREDSTAMSTQRSWSGAAPVRQLAGTCSGRSALGEEAFARAWAEGQAMSLEEAVEYALRDDAEA